MRDSCRRELENPKIDMSVVIDKLVTGGRFWLFKSLLLAILAASIFTAFPDFLIYRKIQLPPAYELKSLRPFADTTVLTVPEFCGERSHGNKLTPRIFGSVLLYLVSKLSWHPYLPATVGGVIFLLSGILTGYQITSDRATGLYLGMLYAGLWALYACFEIDINRPKPFDGIAIGLLSITIVSTKYPYIFTGAAFLSCWTDERAVLSLIYIAVYIVAMSAVDKRRKINHVYILAGVIVAYAITRAILSYALRWNPPDTSMVELYVVKDISNIPSWQESIRLLLAAAWTCFDGGSLALSCALWSLFRRQEYLRLGIIVVCIGLAVGSATIVLDVQRAAAFAFPMIPVGFAVLRRNGVSIGDLRRLAAWGAFVSLLVPII